MRWIARQQNSNWDWRYDYSLPLTTQVIGISSYLFTYVHRKKQDIKLADCLAWPVQLFLYLYFRISEQHNAAALLNSNYQETTAKSGCPLPSYPTRILAVLYLVVVHQDELENQPIDFAGFVFHESTEVVCEEKTLLVSRKGITEVHTFT